MPKALAMIDSMGEIPAHDAELEADTGWLSPEGKLYPCTWRGHEMLAAALGLDTCSAHNWIHLASGAWHSPHALARLHDLDAPPDTITQAQIDTIFDWTAKRGQPMPFWIAKVRP